MAEPGCYKAKGKPNVQCGYEDKTGRLADMNTRLPPSYHPLPYKQYRHEAWEKYIALSVEEDLEKLKNAAAN